MHTRTAARGDLFRAAGCGAAAIAILWSIPMLFGSPDRIVRITWRAADPAARAALEQQFRLTAPIRLDDGTWGYVPGDTSRQTLRALANHPQVAATDGIDPRTFQFARSAPLSPRRGGLLATPPPWMARGARLLAYALALLAGLLLVRARLASTRIGPLSDIRAASAFASLRAWMQRGVPVASAEAAGLFRIVFGTAVLAYVATHPVYPQLLEAYDVSLAGGLYGGVVRWLSAQPMVVQGLATWLNVSGALVVAGFRTPVTFACFVGGFLLWACVYTLTTSSHAVAALGVALICLLPARWGDAWSIDALLRRFLGRSRPLAPSREYAFSFWIPRLVLGLAFLAAAWSKVAGGGLDWILNGTVKYYFVSDFEHAFVPWGPQLTAHHWAAVLMSGMAVFTEALVITAAFSRSDAYRLWLACGALGLLAGFALFQGVLWPGWWILLLGFLPWQRCSAVVPGAFAHAASSFNRAQTVTVAAVVVQQVLVSMTHVEARPLLSAYDMYSATYASVEEYEDAINLAYRVVVFERGRPRELPGCVVDDRAAALVPAAAAGAADERERVRGLIGPCFETASLATEFVLEGDRRVFDWEARRFEWQRSLDVIGPVSADWVRD